MTPYCASFPKRPKPTMYNILFIYCQEENKLILVDRQPDCFLLHPLQLHQNPLYVAHSTLVADPLVDRKWKVTVTDLDCSWLWMSSLEPGTRMLGQCWGRQTQALVRSQNNYLLPMDRRRGARCHWCYNAASRTMLVPVASWSTSVHGLRLGHES